MRLTDKLSLDFDIKLTDSKQIEIVVEVVHDDNPLLQWLEKQDIAWISCVRKDN